MRPLTEIRGIRYGLLEDDDVAEMAGQLAEVFSRHDPLAVAVGIPQSQIEQLVRLLGPQAASDGLTIIARASAGTLIGAMLTDDFAAPQPPGMDVVAPKFAPVGALLESLDSQYRKRHVIIPGTTLHLFMVGVSSPFAGAGIAQSMIRLSFENGRKRGYVSAVTEATGRVSQGIFRKLGFADLYTASYKEFLYEGRPVFSSIEGHEGTILMEMNIAGSSTI